jgi:hypothetical protein
MNSKLTLLALAITGCAYARPTVDVVAAVDLNPTLRTWRKVQPLSYVIINYALPPDYVKGDVAMWEEYHGQALQAGDVFLANYPDKKLFNQVREARAVTATTVTTLLGTTIPLTQVRGVVRRIVRVTK